MAGSPPKKKAKVAPSKTKPVLRFVQAETETRGVVISNSGSSQLALASHNGDSVQLAPGAKHVVTPVLLENDGSHQSGPALEFASRSAAITTITGSENARVTVDASSLREQNAVYGDPEVLLLRGMNGSRLQAARTVLDLKRGENITVIVVGRGPVLNLGMAVRAIFSKPDRELRENAAPEEQEGAES